jgi:hypothetical protein
MISIILYYIIILRIMSVAIAKLQNSVAYSKTMLRILFGPPYTLQKIFLIGALITLIIFMVLIGTAFSVLHNNLIYPPNIASCPDYFEMTEDKKCVNVNDLGNGTCPGRVHDFQKPRFLGPDGIKHKYKKALKCGWQWDGVTNNAKFREV